MRLLLRRRIAVRNLRCRSSASSTYGTSTTARAFVPPLGFAPLSDASPRRRGRNARLARPSKQPIWTSSVRDFIDCGWGQGDKRVLRSRAVREAPLGAVPANPCRPSGCGGADPSAAWPNREDAAASTASKRLASGPTASATPPAWTFSTGC